MYGKPGIAPCGHPGEYVVGQYVRCLQGCDRKVRSLDPDEDTLEFEICPRCKSLDVDESFDLGQLYYHFNPTTPFLNRRCFECGHVWVFSDDEG